MIEDISGEDESNQWMGQTISPDGNYVIGRLRISFAGAKFKLGNPSPEFPVMRLLWAGRSIERVDYVFTLHGVGIAIVDFIYDSNEHNRYARLTGPRSLSFGRILERIDIPSGDETSKPRPARPPRWNTRIRHR